MAVTTGLVIVSHSAHLAEGVVEVAAQMAPDVPLRGCGGMDDGGIGTSFDRVETAVTDLQAAGLQVVVLTDLGSATMTAESVLETVAGGPTVTYADGPLVEGAVAGAVAAQGGGDHTEVARAVAGAAAAWSAGPEQPDQSVLSEDAGEALHRELVLRNEVGLHARPVATLARLVSSYNARVSVNGVDAASVLALMALGLGRGDVIHVSVTGPQAAEALDAVVTTVADGFGEE